MQKNGLLDVVASLGVMHQGGQCRKDENERTRVLRIQKEVRDGSALPQ
jgi:hypothetical protein